MHGTNPIIKQDLSADRLYVREMFPTIQGEGPFAGRPAVFVRLAGCNLRCTFCDTDFDRGQAIDYPVDGNALILAIDKLLPMSFTALPGMEGLAQALTTRPLVVITGGEPLLQPIEHLIAGLLNLGADVQIETAGTVWNNALNQFFDKKQDGMRYRPLTLVCSPKTGKVLGAVARWCSDWKYICRLGHMAEGDGLPVLSTQQEGVGTVLYRPKRDGLSQEQWDSTTIYLQPCEEYKHAVVGFMGMMTGKSKLVPDDQATQRNIDHARDLCLRHGYVLSLQLHKILGMR